MASHSSGISYPDVLSELDGGACLLHVVLGKKGLKTFDQYYSLRSKYCFKKFNEKYGSDSPEIPDPTVPPSIVAYWSKCDSLLQRVISEKKITFITSSVLVKIPGFDGSEKIHVLGKVDGQHCLFELIFGSQLKKKHKIDAVKKLESYATELGKTLQSIGFKVFCLVLGSSEDDVESDKVLREVERDDVLTTKNTVKAEGWNKLCGSFDTARTSLQGKMESADGKDYPEIPTNPSDCGFCPFHNHAFKIQKADGSSVKYVCSGYLHIVT